jgi:hypothetical protein
LLRVKRTLRPLGVALAGRDIFDPDKALLANVRKEGT